MNPNISSIQIHLFNILTQRFFQQAEVKLIVSWPRAVQHGRMPDQNIAVNGIASCLSTRFSSAPI